MGCSRSSFSTTSNKHKSTRLARVQRAVKQAFEQFGGLGWGDGWHISAAIQNSSLVAAASAGDREAFAALLERHYDRIHGLAWQLTGSRADADDIAQDVCCALVEKIGSFRGEAKFTTWL